jgi:hypothetical protein
MSKPAESANPRTTNISPHECNFRTAGATFRDGDGDSLRSTRFQVSPCADAAFPKSTHVGDMARWHDERGPA